VEGSNRTACGVSAPKTSTTEASAAPLMASSLRLRDQRRARKKRDPIEFSFHILDFLSVLQSLLMVRFTEFNDHQVPCLICLVRHFEIAVRWNPSPSSRKNRIAISQ
jgi:hypothetical protein